MNSKLMVTLSSVCLFSFIAACGNPGSSTPGSEDLVTIKSFALSQGLVQQGSDFRMAWNTSSSLPTIGTFYLSHTPDPKKDSESEQIMTLTCGSYSACEWTGEAFCSINTKSQLTCTDPSTEKKSADIAVDTFQGDVYLVLEACAAFDCKTAAQKITIQ